MKREGFLSLCLTAWVLTSSAFAAEFTFKFSTLAPEGTSWLHLWNSFVQRVEKESHGRIDIVTFAGGVVGDEPDMIRKMRLGQIQIVGVTVNGIKNMAPEMDAFHLPFLFQDAQEVDFVRKKMWKSVEKIFAQHHYKLLMWLDNGFINFYSREPFRTPEELARRKVWVWTGDRISAEMLKALGVSPIPLEVPSVLTGLQTGLIDTSYTSPLACLALQWCSEANYIVQIRIRYEGAVVAMPLALWEKIPQDLQTLLTSTFQEYEPLFFRTVWEDHRRSVEAMEENGMEVIRLSPEERKRFVEKTRPLWDQWAGVLYPRQLLDEILKAIKQYPGHH